MRTFGMGPRFTISRFLAGAPNLVAAFNIVVFGVFVALVAQTLGASDQTILIAGLIAALLAVVGFGVLASSMIRRGRKAYHPHFSH